MHQLLPIISGYPQQTAKEAGSKTSDKCDKLMLNAATTINNPSYDQITSTNRLTGTILFTGTNRFTCINKLSDTIRFTGINRLTDTIRFTGINKLSDTIRFTGINRLTDTIRFTGINRLTGTIKFTGINRLTGTTRFTGNNRLIGTTRFTGSNKFTGTNTDTIKFIVNIGPCSLSSYSANQLVVQQLTGHLKECVPLKQKAFQNHTSTVISFHAGFGLISEE
ncbi:hypothetical protein scyTo_0018782 [Scyliorhinus torazame]|uniref:Uncharacterized protein n=1 Tax=Scyliorhinus torazame TaxID=75743 RepID=A0A401Q2K6_SCYTO|nr:hypothetical protein [Scyliorhinus torazame]